MIEGRVGEPRVEFAQLVADLRQFRLGLRELVLQRLAGRREPLPLRGLLLALLAPRAAGALVGVGALPPAGEHERRVVVEVAVEGADPAVVHQPELVHRGAQQVAVVRHEDQRAFVRRQRDRQRLARLHVEVVGRLVEHQHVGPLPRDQRERAARLLAARHRADQRRRHLAGEAVGAEEVAQLLLARFGREPPQVRERRLVGAQLVELVLREVADGQPLAAQQLAGLRREVARDRLDQRRLAGAVDAEDADAIARAHGEADVGQHAALAIAERQAVGVEQPLGQLHRFGELEAPLALRARRFDGGQPLEHLQPALRLPCLGGLRAEAVDELLQVGRRAFVLPGRGVLLAQLLEVRGLERAVVARIAPDRAVGDVPDRLRRAVEELAVVRDQDHGGRLPLQPRLQPHHGVEVEVVGGLVEQQQVGGPQQGARERQPVAPAAGERRDGARGVGLREAEAVQHRAGFRRDGALVQFGDGRYGVREPQVVVRLLGRGEFRARLGERRVAGQHVVDRREVRALDVLRHVGDAGGGRRLQFAGVDRQFAEDGREERRLAAAVGADQADALAGRRDQRDVAVQRACAARDGDVDQPEHRGTVIGGQRRLAGRGATAVLPGVP